MIEIEFSFIQDTPIDTQAIAQVVEEFQASHQVRVHITPMEWGQAWSELFTISLDGRGADVSHIGSTWVSSLVAMNALRAFSPREIAILGGAEAFSRPIWESSKVEGGEQVWAIPWTGNIYLICYRRDLFKQAGIDEAGAFGTVEALASTIQRVQKINVEFPWLTFRMSAQFSFPMLHMAASWVWGSGGDFISKDGLKTLFTQPRSIAGLKAFLQTHRHVPAPARQWEEQQVLNAFRQGKAAMVITDIRSAIELINSNMASSIRENIGTGAISQVPWFGGNTVVIWRHTQGYPERERAAFDLVNFLASKGTQMSFAQKAQKLPARLEAAASLFPTSHPLAATVRQASQNGRDYPSTGLWRRIEFQLADALTSIRKEAVENETADLETILHDQLDPLANRLDLTLKR